MTTIKELLNNYYPNPENNPGYPEPLWETIIGQRECARRMRTDFASNKNLFILNQLCLAYKRNFMPDDVIYLTEKMGIKTWAHLNEWLTGVNKYNPEFMFQTLTGIGRIDIPLESISQAELANFISARFNGLTDVLYKDNTYQATDTAGLMELMSIEPGKHFEWLQESRDCDDIVRIARGWLSKNNIGNIAVADCEINCYFQNEIKYAHNILLAVVKDGGHLDIRFCEPQNGRVWKETDQYQDISIDRIQVRELIF